MHVNNVVSDTNVSNQLVNDSMVRIILLTNVFAPRLNREIYRHAGGEKLLCNSFRERERKR